MSFTHDWMRIGVTAAAVLAFLGGADALSADGAPTQACVEGVPPDLAPYWQHLCHGESRNVVLDHMRGGLAALAAGEADLAARSLDIALNGVEAVYGEDEQAAKARSVWHAEEVKAFKGEPYERTMAYHYRGLLYLLQGDWDNAQASFKSAVLQDSFAELERFRSDVASQVWLEGWANRCGGNADHAGRLFAEAQSLRPSLAPPGDRETVLVVAETGMAPRKSAIGAHREALMISEGLIGNHTLFVETAGLRKPMVVAEDVFFQATTRGGREVDKILADKVSTKEGVGSAGRTAVVAGMATVAAANYSSHNQNNNNNNNNNNAAAAAGAVGLAVVLIGLMVTAAANAMETGADARYWENLPHSIHLAVLPAVQGGFSVQGFDLLDPIGRSVLADRSAVVVGGEAPCTLVWVGSGNVIPSMAVPTAAATGAPAIASSGAAAGSGEAGNCRTGPGRVTVMEPQICRRIGGMTLY